MNMNKHYLISLVICTMTPAVHAQIGPGIVWQRCIGGTSNDFGRYVQQAANGDMLLAGLSYSTDVDITCSNGAIGGISNGDGVAARLDSAGNIRWLNCLGNNIGFPQAEEALAALEFANGESFFFGQFDGPGRFGLDGSLSALSSPVQGRHAIVSADSNIVTVAINGDVRKFTPTGTPIWTRENALMNVIRNTADGGFVSVGTIDNGFPPNSGDAVITKRNSLGNNEWIVDLATAYGEGFYSVAVVADGGYVACGFTNNPDVPGFHETPSGPDSPDIWVVKFSPDGTILWERAFGSSYSEIARSVINAQDGGVVVLCSVQVPLGSQPTGGDILEYKGGEDYWVIKLDAEGDLEWQRTLGGTGQDIPNWIEATSDGGYVLTGSVNSADGDVQGANHITGTGFDIWSVRLQSEFKDTDGDGTPDYQDVCAGGPEPGTPCDDGNAFTALDVITVECQCAGEPDADGDGVPDGSDVCPGGPDPGAPCSDGNPLTALDAIDANCQCVGQPDEDGDGVPNSSDVCPGGPDPGQSCSDGNPFTALDTVTAACQCVGQPDADEDGNPDDGDPCPLQAGLIPGEPCDDGNLNTLNDVVVTFGLNCFCQGDFSTSLSEVGSGTLRIVPNPSNGQVTIASPMGGAGTTVTIFDAYGRMVLRERLTSERQAFDLAQLTKGLYTVIIQTDDGTASQRLLLE